MISRGRLKSMKLGSSYLNDTMSDKMMFLLRKHDTIYEISTILMTMNIDGDLRHRKGALVDRTICSQLILLDRVSVHFRGSCSRQYAVAESQCYERLGQIQMIYAAELV